jgi:hypothetical protein
MDFLCISLLNLNKSPHIRFFLYGLMIVKECPLTFSSGGKPVLKVSQRLHYVLDNAC